MSDPSEITDNVEIAQDAFEYAGRGRPDFETGIDQDAEWKTQLTKACRYLDSVRVLREEDGYNGSVIELSYGAIERTLEAYLLWNSDDSIEDYRDHVAAYNRAAQQGLFERDTAEDIKGLYQDNRTGHYYGAQLPTQQKEDAMFQLAESIHMFVEDQIREGDICICD